MDGHITVAFRHLLPSGNDSLLNILSVWLTSSKEAASQHIDQDLCHVEIGFPVRCAGPSSCVYCNQEKEKPAHKSDMKENSPMRMHHTLSYSITGVPGKDKTFYYCDRVYNPKRWTILSYKPSGDTHKVIHTLSAFLYHQLDKDFNKDGYYRNFLPCVTPQGCLRVEDALECQKWFCSELVIAALQHTQQVNAGEHMLPDQEVVPCQTSPNQLFRMLMPHWQQETRLLDVIEEDKEEEEEKPLLVR